MKKVNKVAGYIWKAIEFIISIGVALMIMSICFFGGTITVNGLF